MTRTLSVLLTLLISLAGAPALAQVAGESTPSELVSRALVRTALIDLRSQTEPTPADYALVARVLEVARSLAPEDTDLLRRLIEAHRSAGNELEVMRLTRDLVRLDPGDSVAQLRLLSWNASRKQTVQERLDVYARYLGPEGAQAIPDPAVRSRLALDAALLHRETGDEAEFVRLLAQATALDSSNKEAAALASAFYQERRDDPVARLELALNVLRADPIDPNLHFSVAAELARHGVFDQAERFHTNGRRLVASDGITQDPGLETEATIIRWHNMGPETVIAEFERTLIVQREAARQRIEQLIKSGLSTEGQQKPEDVRLPIFLERLRTLAALEVGDRVVLERSLGDLSSTAIPELQELASRMETPAAKQDPQLTNMLASRAATVASELVVARLVSGLVTPSTIAEIDQFRGLFQSAAKTQLDVIDALIVLRRGQTDEAIARLTPLAEVSTLGSVGLGLALETAGRADEAAEAFKKTALFSPISPMGVYARSKYESLSGTKLVFSESAGALRRVAEGAPRWIDEITTSPTRFMALTATLERAALEPYEDPVVVLSLRNTAPIPLAVGSDRTINSRFMISPAMDVNSFPVSEVLTPEVADLQRRIRLTPGEGMTVRIWPDPGFSGWLAEIKSAHRVRSRWNLLQGFVVGEGTLYRPGAMCLAVETPQLTRRPDERVRAPLADLIRELEICDEGRLARSLATVRSVLADPDRPGERPSAEQIQRIASVLSARYPALSREGRLAVIAFAPHAAMVPGMEQLDERVLAETDPELLAVALLTRARSAALPALARAQASDDPGFAAFGRYLQARLEGENPRGFALTSAPGSHRPPEPEHPESIVP